MKVRNLLTDQGDQSVVTFQRQPMVPRFAPLRLGAPPQAAATARAWAAHQPYANGSTACRMRSAYRLRGFGTFAPSPLRHCGDTLAPTPTGDYRPSRSLSMAGSDRWSGW